MWECDRCGKCCIEFTHQICFQDNEPLLELYEKSPNIEQNPLISLFFRIKDFFKKDINGKKQFFVPTKVNLLKY